MEFNSVRFYKSKLFLCNYSMLHVLPFGMHWKVVLNAVFMHNESNLELEQPA